MVRFERTGAPSVARPARQPERLDRVSEAIVVVSARIDLLRAARVSAQLAVMS